eukprot:GILJ01004617.1.p3 GENE.GILJ01004617.1~~GILJ01004617.1.p3  ORF type:complete len:170 (-),score=47.24 GILJ01004617.1:1544-2053(-)
MDEWVDTLLSWHKDAELSKEQAAIVLGGGILGALVGVQLVWRLCSKRQKPKKKTSKKKSSSTTKEATAAAAKQEAQKLKKFCKYCKVLLMSPEWEKRHVAGKKHKAAAELDPDWFHLVSSEQYEREEAEKKQREEEDAKLAAAQVHEDESLGGKWVTVGKQRKTSKRKA